uniref:secretin N-terminal domain-containing protein n=1 Tax=Salinispora pacifica TaxID=351187 RepID=UPI0012FAE951
MALRCTGGACTSSGESSSANRSAKSSTESSSATASGRPAAVTREVTVWSSLSAAIAAPLGPPDRSTSSVTNCA